MPCCSTTARHGAAARGPGARTIARHRFGEGDESDDSEPSSWIICMAGSDSNATMSHGSRHAGPNGSFTSILMIAVGPPEARRLPGRLCRIRRDAKRGGSLERRAVEASETLSVAASLRPPSRSEVPEDRSSSSHKAHNQILRHVVSRHELTHARPHQGVDLSVRIFATEFDSCWRLVPTHLRRRQTPEASRRRLRSMASAARV